MKRSTFFAFGAVIFVFTLDLALSSPDIKKGEERAVSMEELARLEERAVQAEARVKELCYQLSNIENLSTLRLLHQELNAVEAGVEPSGSWPNYYTLLIKKLNRERADPMEVNKILDRMVDMSKKGKYFFPEQKSNLEAFYRDVEDLRPKK